MFPSPASTLRIMQPPLFHRPSFPIIFLLSFLVSQVSCMCYAANGSAVWNWGPESIYQPCSNDSSNPLSTICCATNRANPPGGSISDGFTADICLPSGLCQNILTDEDGTVLYAYWRDYCTISQWTKDKCLKVCTGDGVRRNSRYVSTPTLPFHFLALFDLSLCFCVFDRSID